MYTLIPKAYVVQSDSTEAIQLFCDTAWENFSEAELPEHFANVYVLLQDRLAVLKNPRTTLSAHEEKELRIMLDALIHAKRLLTEKLDKE